MSALSLHKVETQRFVNENLITLTDSGLLRRLRDQNGHGSDHSPLEQVGVALHELDTSLVSIETARGYSWQEHGNKSVTVFDQFARPIAKTLRQIEPGDRVPLRIGGLTNDAQGVTLPPLPEAHWTSDYSTRVPRRMNADLAEFIGYFMGDGSLHPKGIRLCVAKDDIDVAERLSWMGQELFGLQSVSTRRAGYIELAFNSIRLVLWWEACGFAKHPPHANHRGKGYAPHIPQAVLYTDDAHVYAAFIRGLFEADGTVTNHYVSWTTTTFSFSRDVQTLLLALGFVSTRKFDKPTKTSWAVNTRFVLRLLNVSSIERFLQQIGFISQRKNTLTPSSEHSQTARYDHIPISRQEIDRLAPSNGRLRRVLLLSSQRNQTMTRRIGEELLQQTGDPKLKELLNFYYDEVVAVNHLCKPTFESQWLRLVKLG